MQIRPSPQTKNEMIKVCVPIDYQFEFISEFLAIAENDIVQCTPPNLELHYFRRNKLAKARKTRKSPATLGLKNIGLGKLWVEKVWAQNIVINFLAELDHIKKINYCFFYFFLPFPPGPISGNPTHT